MFLYLRQSILHGRRHNIFYTSVRPFVRYQRCEHDILKMNKPTSMQTCTSGPRSKDVKLSTLGSGGQGTMSQFCNLWQANAEFPWKRINKWKWERKILLPTVFATVSGQTIKPSFIIIRCQNIPLWTWYVEPATAFQPISCVNGQVSRYFPWRFSLAGSLGFEASSADATASTGTCPVGE